MIEKAAAVLAGGIDHSTGKAALRHEPMSASFGR
jgi:hypothetical protein